jgi:hypothetical protein
MRIIQIMLSAALLLTTHNICAQEEAPVSLKAILQAMPVPKPSLKEMMADNSSHDVIESGIAGAFSAINKRINVLYRPVYERYKIAAAKPGLPQLSAAEQTMLTNMRQGANGLSDAVQFDLFKIQMGHRKVVGNGVPMWAHTTPSEKSASVQKMEQQLKALEAGFDWPTFFSTVEKYVMKFGGTNKSLEAIHTKFNHDLENLPKRKVILSGIPQETADPDKAIALCKEYRDQRQQVFDIEYATVYKWWQQQYNELRNIAERTDAIALELHSMDDGDRRSVQPFLTDIQIRTVEAFYKLTAVTQRLYNDRLIAMMGDQQVNEMIDMYTQYKAGE